VNACALEEGKQKAILKCLKIKGKEGRGGSVNLVKFSEIENTVNSLDV
jgi:hypothetical protein